jgi:TIR domain
VALPIYFDLGIIEPVAARDFFISYTSADRVWAEWIAWQLEDAGYQVKIQAWDFSPGGNFVVEKQKAAMECERTIAVFSPNYFLSEFAEAEWAAAFRLDPTGKNEKLIPVRIDDCQPPGLLGSIIYIDLVKLDETTARDRRLCRRLCPVPDSTASRNSRDYEKSGSGTTVI